MIASLRPDPEYNPGPTAQLTYGNAGEPRIFLYYAKAVVSFGGRVLEVRPADLRPAGHPRHPSWTGSHAIWQGKHEIADATSMDDGVETASAMLLGAL